MSALFVRDRKEGCLSDLALDRLVGFPEDTTGAGQGREHLLGCTSCRALLDVRRAEQAAFLDRPFVLVSPATSGPTEVRPKSRARPVPHNRRGMLFGFAAALAAGIAIFVLGPPLPEDPGVRRKGAPLSIGYFIKHRDTVRRAGPHEIVAPGDSLRFYYSADRPYHLSILSLDGEKNASTYYQGKSAEPPGQEVPLPEATVLDVVLGDERIVALFCETPIDVAPLKRALEAGQTGLTAPTGCKLLELSMEKKAESQAPP